MLLAAALCSALSLPQSPPPATIDWRPDLDAARAEAARSGRPLLVLFRCEP